MDKNNFKRDVLRLVSGSGISQFVVLLATPILARLFDPGAFGLAAQFMSITGILGVIACMRYEHSVVLSGSDREAANMLTVCLISSLCVSLFALLIIWVFGKQWLSLAVESELPGYLWLVPVAVLINGIFTALNYWSMRAKEFTIISISRVIGSLGNVLFSLGAGLLGYAFGVSIIIASIVGQGLSAGVISAPIFKKNGRSIVSGISLNEMFLGAKRYKNLLLYGSLGAVINSASWQIPVLFIGLFFSPIIVGYYAFGLRLFQMPMALIGASVGQVFFQRASQSSNAEIIPSLVSLLMQRMLIFTFLPTLFLMLLGRELFVFVFGGAWAEAGVYAQILAPWALVWFASTPLVGIFAIMGKQKDELKVHACIFVVRIGSVLIGGVFGSPFLTICLLSAGGFLAYGYLLCKIISLSRLSLVSEIDKSLPTVCSSIIATVPVVLVMYFWPNSGVSAIILAAIVCMSYFWIHKKLLFNA